MKSFSSLEHRERREEEELQKRLETSLEFLPSATALAGYGGGGGSWLQVWGNPRVVGFYIILSNTFTGSKNIKCHHVSAISNMALNTQ